MMNIRIGKQFLLREQLLLIFISGIWDYLLERKSGGLSGIWKEIS
jgi:hypothetical protein